MLKTPFCRTLYLCRALIRCSYKPSTSIRLVTNQNLAALQSSIRLYSSPANPMNPPATPDEKKPTLDKRKKIQKRRDAVQPMRSFEDEIVAKPLAKSFDLEAIRNAVHEGDPFWSRYKALYVEGEEIQEFDHVIRIRLKDKYHEGDRIREFYVFEEGVVVYWGMDPQEIADVNENIVKFASGVNSLDIINVETEKMSFFKNDKDGVRQHAIHLTDLDRTREGYQKRMAFSQSFAVSVKIGTWENEIDNIKEPFEKLPKILMAGKTRFNDVLTKFSDNLSFRERWRKWRLSKKLWKINECQYHLGRLTDLRYRMNLKSELYDRDVFWDYPELEDIFDQTCRYLETDKRLMIINNAITECENLNKSVENIVHAQHGWKLEWIIITLIAVEVLFHYHVLMEIFHDICAGLKSLAGAEGNKVLSYKEDDKSR